MYKNTQKAMLNSSKCILSGKLIVYQNDQITRKKITANIYPNLVEIIYSYHAWCSNLFEWIYFLHANICVYAWHKKVFNDLPFIGSGSKLLYKVVKKKTFPSNDLQDSLYEQKKKLLPCFGFCASYCLYP